jgi:hypothetical protein
MRGNLSAVRERHSTCAHCDSASDSELPTTLHYTLLSVKPLRQSVYSPMMSESGGEA